MPHFPDEDAKLRATSLVVRRGGNGANSLDVLRQFAPAPDVALYLVATLPNRHCAATAKVLSSLTSGDEVGRVDLSHCIYREDESETAVSYILSSQATGSRTIVNHNALAEMTVEDFASIAETFRKDDADTWWHFEVSGWTSTLT